MVTHEKGDETERWPNFTPKVHRAHANEVELKAWTPGWRELWEGVVNEGHSAGYF